MQTLIKVSNRIKWYFVKFIIWLTSPITLFKNYLTLFERLEHRVHKLEGVNDFSDIEQRLEDLEYYDLDDIQEKAENAEREAEENNNTIDMIKDDIKTIKKADFEGSEEIADRFDKIDNSIDYCKEYIVENRIENVSCETFNELVDRVKRLENSTAIEHIYNDVDRLDKRLDAIEGETSTKKIREIVAEVLCDKGLQLNILDERINKIESEQLLKGPQYDFGKQERSEESLSAMQKLSFEICMRIFGDFNLDDFNNCYDIINKYDVKEGK